MFFSIEPDKKGKAGHGTMEKKRRERISTNIHALAEMLPEEMRDPKHKEVNVI